MGDHIMRSFVRCIVIACTITVCVSGQSSAQGGGYGTTFAADLAFPMGVFANSFKTGLGGHVDFYFESEKYLRLDVLLGYTRWGVDQDKINERYTAEGGQGTLQLEGHMNAFPIMVGVHLLSPEGGMRFYGGDVYDTYSEKLVCLECGAEVEPVKQYVPKFEYVGF